MKEFYVKIEAIQFTGDNESDVKKFIEDSGLISYKYICTKKLFATKTLEYTNIYDNTFYYVIPGSYIVKLGDMLLIMAKQQLDIMEKYKDGYNEVNMLRKSVDTILNKPKNMVIK